MLFLIICSFPGVSGTEVDREEEAREIMEKDAGVKAKIFTAELFPFSVAMIRDEERKKTGQQQAKGSGDEKE